MTMQNCTICTLTAVCFNSLIERNESYQMRRNVYINRSEMNEEYKVIQKLRQTVKFIIVYTYTKKISHNSQHIFLFWRIHNKTLYQKWFELCHVSIIIKFESIRNCWNNIESNALIFHRRKETLQYTIAFQKTANACRHST